MKERVGKYLDASVSSSNSRLNSWWFVNIIVSYSLVVLDLSNWTTSLNRNVRINNTFRV